MHEPRVSRVDVDGVTLCISAAGLDRRNPGEPVVVFESGGGAPLETWGSILQDVAQFAPLVAYDRSGTANRRGMARRRLRARRFLRAFGAMTSPEATIVAEVIDPYRTEEPFHLAYHQSNCEKGRLPGQLRIRVRYKVYRTPWFDYLFVSPDEMRDLVKGSGWSVDEVIESGGPVYVGVLRKE